jgi:DNA repair protein RadC
LTLKLQDLPKYERPYEKLEFYGEESLSNSELLAIILGSGTKKETSVNLAQKVLCLNNELSGNEFKFINDISLHELKKIKGIGRVKAIRIKAMFEIAKRLSKPLNYEMTVNSSKDVAKIFMEELRFEKREVVKIVILNNKNKIIRIEDISLGGTNYAMLEPKDVLSEPIKMGAGKIILVHNHPSGNPTPSAEDYQVTKRIDLCAKMLGIELLDHVVIGDMDYRSVKI